MLNISSIKELLPKPSEVQWNITGTLPKKLKEKLLGLYPTRYYLLKSQKCEELLFRGVFEGPGNRSGIQWFSMIFWISESFSLYLLIKNTLNFKLGFFTYFEYISWVSSEKTFSVQITIMPDDINAKKTRTIFWKIHVKFFLNASLWILHFYEHLWLKTFVKIHFQVHIPPKKYFI